MKHGMKSCDEQPGQTDVFGGKRPLTRWLGLSSVHMGLAIIFPRWRMDKSKDRTRQPSAEMLLPSRKAVLLVVGSTRLVLGVVGKRGGEAERRGKTWGTMPTSVAALHQRRPLKVGRDVSDHT